MQYAEHKNQLIKTVPPISIDVAGLFDALRNYFANRRAISQLKGMSRHQLADIGITRSQIKAAVSGDLYR